ncbi:hypothetical protein QQ045_030746 [Rhodiola kirilowii]
MMACAACKYQRRKCGPDCILAMYFPQERANEEFMNVQKLFGVSNILKVLKKINEAHSRDEAVKCMIFHANARKADPVSGCYGIVLNLTKQIELYQAELDLVMHQLNAFRTITQNVQRSVVKWQEQRWSSSSFSL